MMNETPASDKLADEQQLIEALADKVHASWARWMDYLFSKCRMNSDGSYTLPASYARHWRQEARTTYSNLPEPAKQSDRNEVAHILPVIQRFADAQNATLWPIIEAVATEIDPEDDHFFCTRCMSTGGRWLGHTHEMVHKPDCIIVKARALVAERKATSHDK